jgi:hypothetical protein
MKLIGKSSTQQRGNALLFTLLALVLGGIGLAVGVQQYQEAERATSVQAVVGEVNSIIGAAKQNFGQYNYAGLTTASAIASQVIPARLVTGSGTSTTATHRFNGAITLVEGTVTAGTAVLSYADVPSDLCMNIVNGTHGMARQVQVGTTNVKPLDSSVVLASLTTQCTGTGTVTISWTIGRS